MEPSPGNLESAPQFNFECLYNGRANRAARPLFPDRSYRRRKTVASLAFALSLAVKNHMDRVIYVIPYTSIIDQTADVFSEILGAENVLEHHSGVDYSAKEDDEPAAYRKALAAENWDAPVVVTTSVQFFESLYGNHASQCRKLHNIANSVVILTKHKTCRFLICAPALRQSRSWYSITAQQRYCARPHNQLCSPCLMNWRLGCR